LPPKELPPPSSLPSLLADESLADLDLEKPPPKEESTNQYKAVISTNERQHPTTVIEIHQDFLKTFLGSNLVELKWTDIDVPISEGTKIIFEQLWTEPKVPWQIELEDESTVHTVVALMYSYKFAD